MYYKYFKTEDFVADPFFQDWVKQPNEESELFWSNWLSENPDKKGMIEEARDILLFLRFKVEKPTEKDFKDVKSGIMNAIVSEDSNAFAVFSKPEKNQRFASRDYFKIAASLLVIAFLTSLYFFIAPFSKEVTYKTNTNELRTIILPDRSKVTLNSNSQIKFAKKWEGTEAREVWLSGEAFFEVAKKQVVVKNNRKRIKFIVHTLNLDVEVLGTRFNVENRESRTKVVLNSGKINLKLNVNNQQKNIMMKPGELVEFSKVQNTISKTKVLKPEIYSAWQNKDLEFDEQSLEEIAEVLKTQMGVEIVIESKELSKMKFTGSTPRNNLDILFTSIANSFDAEISKENDKIIIKTKE
jgi:transmembrane sensor